VNKLKIPNEITWISFFDSEPRLLDEGIPHYYNEINYKFVNNDNERFIITMVPSCSEFKIEIFKGDTDELLGILNLKNIETIDILSDKEEEKRIMITSRHGVMKIDFAPRYKIFVNQLLID